MDYFPKEKVEGPDLNWEIVKDIGVNKDQLINALSHGSSWVSYAARNLLLNLDQLDEKDIRTILSEASGDVFKHAIDFSKKNDNACVELFINRAKGRHEEGLNHVFDWICTISPAWNKALIECIKSGIFSKDDLIAISAFNLAFHYVDNFDEDLIGVIKDAHRHWIAEEKTSTVHPDEINEIKRIISKILSRFE